jgi:hypothetical protein
MQMTTDEVIQFFEELRRRPLPRWHIAVWTYFILGGPLLLGVICRSSFVYEPSTAWAGTAATVLFCGLNLHLGIMYLENLHATRYAPGRMARELRDGKNTIAWLYIETITTYYKPAPQPYLYFHFTNRVSGRVNAPLETVTRVMNYFDAHYPDISLGYDGKLARRFIFRPGSLKTVPVRHRLEKKTVHTIISADN